MGRPLSTLRAIVRTKRGLVNALRRPSIWMRLSASALPSHPWINYACASCLPKRSEVPSKAIHLEGKRSCPEG